MNPSVAEQVLLALGMLVLIFLPFYWHRMLAVATAWRKTGGRINDGELELAELLLPAGWKSTDYMKGHESIRVTDRLARRFVVVISESRQDFSDSVTLSEFHGMTFAQLVRAGDVVEMGAAIPRRVGDLDALQSEVVLILQRRFVTKYLHTTVLGRRGLHQIIGWSAESTFDRAMFEAVIDGFRERSGPATTGRRMAIPMQGSDYDVH